MRFPRSLPALLALLASACTADLSLPASPDSAPVVTGFAPAGGVAGVRVTVQGSNFRDPCRVRFGDGGDAAAQVAADGKSLTALVPENAATGVLAVSVNGTEGHSHDAFQFGGIDHLAYGRVVRMADLRPHVEQAFPLGADEGLFVRRPFARFVGERNGPLELGDLHLVTAAAVRRPSGLRLVLVDEDPDPSSDPLATDPIGKLWVVDAPFSDSQTVTSIDVPRAGTTRLTAATLALTDDGEHAFIRTDSLGYLADLAAGTIRTFTLPDDQEELGPVLGADGRFFLGVNASLLELDAESGETLSRSDRLVDLGVSAIARSSSGELALGGGAGGVVRLANERPFRVDATFRTYDAYTVTSLAFDEASGRLAAVSEQGAHLLLFDARGDSPDPTPLAVIPFEDPGAVVAAGDGTFHVAHVSGYSLVAASTGAVVDTFPAGADLAGLTTYTLTEGRQPHPDVQEFALSLASAAFDRAIRLDPQTLAVYDSPDQLDTGDHGSSVDDLASPGPRRPLVTLASAPRSPRLYAVREGPALWKTRDDSSLVELPDAFPFPADAMMVGMPQPSDDGSAVVLTLENDDSGADGFAYALPAAADWTTFQPHAFRIDGEVVQQAFFDHAGRLVLVGKDKVRFLDGAKALQGVEAPVGDDVQVRDAKGDAHSVQLAFNAPAGVLVVDGSGTVIRVVPGGKPTFFPLPLGAASINRREGSSFVLSAVLTPAGRRIYWMEPIFNGTLLRSVTLDPTTGEPLAREPDVNLPAVSELHFLDDGTRAVALDGVGDRIYLID